MLHILLVENTSTLRRLLKVTLSSDRSKVEFEERTLTRLIPSDSDIPNVHLVVIGAYAPLEPVAKLISRMSSCRPRPAIVALMTDTRESQKAFVLEAGADAVVEMPFRPDHLREAAWKAATRRGHLDANP